MTHIQYKSREISRDGNRTDTSVTFYGTFSEIEALERDAYSDPLFPNRYNITGKLQNSKIIQSDGDIWQLTLQFSTNEADVTMNTSPESTEYGKFSATLSSNLITMPLETHPQYRTHWNYFLAAGTSEPGSYSGGVPGWWQTAKDHSDVGGSGDSVIYRWVKDTSSLPTYEDIGGRGVYWHIIADPVIEDGDQKYKGVENYEVEVYTVTESAKFRTPTQAGKYVSNVLNKIGRPQEEFSLTWGDWKCDGVSVQWTGKYWKATLNWTHSGDYRGWCKTLYDLEG